MIEFTLPSDAVAASGDGFTPKDHTGDLLAIQPVERRDITTSFGDREVTVANIHVVDGAEPGKVYTNTFVFPLVLQGKLKSNVGTGKWNLGRLGKAAAKPGQNPAWDLLQPDAADIEKAKAYVQQHNLTDALPAAPASAPISSGWGASDPTAPPF